MRIDTYVLNYLILMGSMVITGVAQWYVSHSYNNYKRILNKKKISGVEVAREILDSNGLEDVMVVETRGELTDHYDPERKVIRLSRKVFHDASIASVAVASHECGHALQDKDGNKLLKLRGKMVPFVNFCSKIGYLAIVIGIIANVFDIAIFGIIMLLAILVFQGITLPIEFDASKRALKEINKLKLLNNKEQDDGKRMLRAAALTYVASLATTVLEILRLLMISYNNRDRD